MALGFGHDFGSISSDPFVSHAARWLEPFGGKPRPSDMVIWRRARLRFAVIARRRRRPLEHFPGRSRRASYPSIRFRHSVSSIFFGHLVFAGKEDGRKNVRRRFRSLSVEQRQRRRSCGNERFENRRRPQQASRPRSARGDGGNVAGRGSRMLDGRSRSRTGAGRCSGSTRDRHRRVQLVHVSGNLYLYGFGLLFVAFRFGPQAGRRMIWMILYVCR